MIQCRKCNSYNIETTPITKYIESDQEHTVVMDACTNCGYGEKKTRSTPYE